MKRVEIYCDICGKQMSYQDADGETCMSGLEVSLPLRVTTARRNKGSESHHNMHIDLAHYCSIDCFTPQLDRLKAQITAALK